jgi:hypothetical protein
MSVRGYFFPFLNQDQVDSSTDFPIRTAADAERSTAARKFYTHLKKEESRDNGVRTEKVSGKAVCDRAPESRQNVDWQSANRAHPLVTTPYLAIYWQRGQINARFTWETKGFLLLNQRLVTCFGLTNKGKPPLCYRSGYGIPAFSVAGMIGKRREGGGGGQRVVTGKIA